MTTINIYDKDSEKVVFLSGEATVKIDTPKHDSGFGLLAVNNDASADATITVKAGNSVFSMGDMAVTVKAGETHIINLKNTGRFKNVSGENSGKVVITVSGITASKLGLFPFAL